MREYQPLYSEAAVEIILGLPKRRQQKFLAVCQQLARDPFVKPDYSITDSDSREIGHILIEGFVIAYWVDHPVCKVMIVEVDDVR
jgi:hypothetical protein